MSAPTLLTGSFGVRLTGSKGSSMSADVVVRHMACVKLSVLVEYGHWLSGRLARRGR